MAAKTSKPRPGSEDPHRTAANRKSAEARRDAIAKAEKKTPATAPKATPHERKSFNRETQARDKAGKFRPAPVKQ